MASSSSDQDATPLSYFKYDVFLSFRGYTRFDFTDMLYHALIKARIETFRDKEGLRIGEELDGSLVEAIERSRMSVLVLCDKYPTSKWCLDELVKIMECSENGKTRPVLPIYFHVQRSDVQYEKNSYRTAMIDQEKGRYKHRVEAWRSALSAVGTIYGQNISRLTAWGEAIDKIVEEVTTRLPPLPLHIDRPLGCDSELEEVKFLLEIGSHATCFMLGIYGDGDEISKFVAELYNKIRPHFVIASFLSNISEKTNESGGGLEHLQETLLSEMGEVVKTKIGSTFKGSSEIKRRLGQKRVLLVLDDVDNIQQLNSLAGGTDWFGPGSRIIITTRYEDVLDDHVSNNGVEVKRYYFTQGSSSTTKEENIVGLEKDFEIVINQLKEANSPGNVVSIVGMGGLGKTTLARKIFDSNEVKKLFSCRAWATVSKDFRGKEVFRSLLNLTSKSKHKDSSSEEELKEKVRKYLNGKKYLVVLDDVWDTNNAWGALRGCFPKNNNGSMILLTTRDDRVANVSESKKPHHRLSFLDKKESWKLFCNEVFCSKKCPRDLQRIGRSIAQSCNGFPLAIKTIAGIVAKRERSEDAWEEIKNLLPYWSVAEDKEGKKMMEILKLSYDDLSEKMKPCFLYLGVFPEDIEIRVRDLIEVWIAERLIEPIQSGRSKVAPEPEDIGEQYLKELVDRNLVQVASRRSDGKGIKTCKIHDLIRELCISVSNSPDNGSNARRLSFPRDIGSYACSVTCHQSCTYSLFIYGDVKGWSHHIPQDCRVNVLYFEGWIDDLSHLTNEKNVENLKELKSVKFLKIDIFYPNELSKLESIQTLHIMDDETPKDLSIGGLKQLRHFRRECEVCLLVDKDGVKNKMQNLQTLLYVHVDSRLGFLLNNGYFPNLRTLGLSVTEGRHSAEKTFSSLHCLSNLQKLKLELPICESFPIPVDKIAFPSNLSKLTISYFDGLKSEDMNTLGRIPGLRILKFNDVRCIENILNCGTDRSFLQLQVFIMIRVCVKCLTLEDGAMPRLRRAVFHGCPGLELKYLPQQMHSLGCNLHFKPHGDDDDDDDDFEKDDDDDEDDDDDTFKMMMMVMIMIMMTMMMMTDSSEVLDVDVSLSS
ncbi:putative disease resistance RPP13-like protein 3 [Arachis duranensis]|uniref:Disease resistance RPP13-like protein 3 n=1 Tax=Arachis duranensis TaxID=130453 RepID=A0A9C6WS76_ARADU|nr:putative disease resistance RPP13-like protein 3 [Arachis duranensis]XP_052116014.1 putative disease resistance RPP13-like protein 3 [Arachis duranensis]